MSQLKPSSHGIVVDHKETGVRYAISDVNYNPDLHKKVRDLKPGESVLAYQPRSRESLQEIAESQGAPKGAQGAAVSAGGDSETAAPTSGSANHTK
ncbi:hypothetical protein SEA_NUCCI_12 [Microbacterium phage Nucci]|nr:hypothetical protein SEA_NUCCI_12 [Microbacterium phage Nucci]QXO13606.1 hypothetical protein SEA_MANDALORIAN_12 [Microbacterium phage Mandalorian]UVK59231.1 hypothetical protein SEA_QUARTZ_12 [Microbacterium phage Quartz]